MDGALASRSFTFDAVYVVAFLAATVAVGAALAHALELPNKIALPRDEYFIVQKAYRGWNNLAFVLIVEFLGLIALAFLARAEPSVMWPVVAAIACLLLAQALFWTLTQPANLATRMWTFAPDNWRELRRNWEYSHLGGALLQVAGLAALAIAALIRARA